MYIYKREMGEAIHNNYYGSLECGAKPKVVVDTDWF